MHTKFLLKKLKGRDHLEDPGTDGRIIQRLPERGWKDME
jgi:hypothetical protein